jgi:hypothetical protein
MDFLFADASGPQAQGYLIKNQGEGNHLVGVLHDIPDLLGPFLDGISGQILIFQPD